jgi:hypothetical protein
MNRLQNHRGQFAKKNSAAGAALSKVETLNSQKWRPQEAAARCVRLRELRWKNSAWLATADTIAGWNGLEIRKAGSGRSPVRKRSG